MAAALAHRLGQRPLADAEILCEPAIAFRFLQRREVLTLEVFHQREFQGLAIRKIDDDDRDLGELGPCGRPPAPFPGDDFI